MNKSEQLQAKYNVTAFFYDILDYPWERQYKHWRPRLLQDIHGRVLEAGVGTGRNFKYYQPDVELIGIDLSKRMLERAKKRAKSAACPIELRLEDAAIMQSIPSDYFDWMISTFLYCVLPEDLQSLAITQLERVLKLNGKFRILEIVYSKDKKLRKRQEFFAPFVEKIYGARFDRNTLEHLYKSSKVEVINTYFLKADTYLIIEGRRIK